MVWDEATLVVERQNRAMASEAVLIQAAVAALLAKEAGESFGKLVDGLTDPGT